tara:strand:+ start:222 stop:374 length:153 start_codon:yes stop_codon:yes gene_type:complete
MIHDNDLKELHNRFFKMMGCKPRRKKKSHQWWESPWMDYDDPRNCYYEVK